MPVPWVAKLNVRESTHSLEGLESITTSLCEQTRWCFDSVKLAMTCNSDHEMLKLIKNNNVFVIHNALEDMNSVC